MYGVHAAHRREVTKDDLVGADSDYRTVDFEEFLDDFALLEAEDVRCGSRSRRWPPGIALSGDKKRL